MSRPNKPRMIYEMPRYHMYGPKGKRANSLDKISLLIDEYETIRLMDQLGLTQEQTSKKMGVARTTVQRIYNNARKKIADSIINGKILVIEGGDYIFCEGKDCKHGQKQHRRGKGKAFNKFSQE
ncbi:MAG: DUF134 domain-containing protein [Candidatus Izimaplasma sp.]|nr:DUF134 domain-containing protein [Candidatus Izimaplasma bacterium]